MNDEADLCEQDERESDRDAQECDIAKRLGTDAAGRRHVREGGRRRDGSADGRLSDEDQDHRHHHHQHHCGNQQQGLGKSEQPDRGDQQRYTDNAAEACPIQCKADRHAALGVEPETERVGDRAKARAGPAQGEHGVGRIKLPRLGHPADQHRCCSEREYANQQAIAWTDRSDRLADKGDQQSTEQIEKGRRAGDDRGRPSMRPVQFGDIDALTIKAETPAENRHQETDRDDAPAVVPDGIFISDRAASCVQLADPWLFKHRPSRRAGTAALTEL